MKVDVIIPVHNIKKRGFKRLHLLCHSLMLQSDFIGKVYVPDSSTNEQYKMAGMMVDTFDFVDHFKVDNQFFNKPKLINEAIKRSKSDYIFVTDCDYIFSKDLLKHCENRRDKKTILFKKTMDLPNMNYLNTSIIDRWKFPRLRKNAWGTLANGAMQYAHRDFFIKAIKDTPEYLNMEGWGAMDNIIAYIAKHQGLNIHWIEEGLILHQYHRSEKRRDSMDVKRFNSNQKILMDYCRKTNQPQTLLTLKG